MNRHTARLANTDQRCVVVFKQLPDRATHALVISIDNLPARYEAALMGLVESAEGQAEVNLSNLLGRRIMPEMGKTVLQVFHETGLMHPVPIDNVLMSPVPNQQFPLRQVLEQMGIVVPAADSATVAAAAQRSATKLQEEINTAAQRDTKFNPYGDTQAIRVSGENSAKAQNLLIEAEMLDHEANRKRQQAYEADPSRRPAPAAAILPGFDITQGEIAINTIASPAKPKRAPRKKAGQ